MDTTTATAILISSVSGGLVGLVTAFLTVSYKMWKYTEKVDQLEKNNLHGRLSTLEGKFDSMKDASAFIKRKSPISLTDRGEEMINVSQGKALVDSNYQMLLNFIKEKNPTTAYDVQEYSFKVLDERRDEDIFIPLKNYAFNEGIDYDLILKVVSVYLRDKALIDFNFTQADIDKYDPSKQQPLIQ